METSIGQLAAVRYNTSLWVVLWVSIRKLYFIDINQLLKASKWRTDRDSKIIDLIPLISLYIYLYDLNSSVNSSVTMRF